MDKKFTKKAKIEQKEEKQSSFEQTLSFLKVLPHAILFVMILNGIAIASFVVPTGSMENEVMTGDFLFVNRFKYGPTTPQIIPLLNIPLPNYKFPGFWEPRKGDVIVFVYPGDRDELVSDEFLYYLKRCMATAGDTLMIINKNVYINGKIQDLPKNVNFIDGGWGNRPANFPKDNPNWTMDNFGPLVIPKKGDIIELNINNYDIWEVFIRREGANIAINRSTNEIIINDKVTNKYKVKRDYCFGMGDNRHNSEDSRDWGFIPYENVVGTPLFVYWSWDTDKPFAQIFDKLKSVRFERILTFID